MTGFFIVGLNHKQAPVDIREKLVMESDVALGVLNELNEFVEEALVLSTCNRSELIAFDPNHDAHRRASKLLQQRGQLSDEDVERYFYTHHGRPALAHLFRVAAGLDSMVLGETQILGQVKVAFEQAFRVGAAQARLHAIYQRMLNTAKAVRTETGIGRGLVSVSSVAVSLSRNIFESLHEHEVLLLGAGETGELAAEAFDHSGVSAVHVANRSPERAFALAKRFGGNAFAIDDLENALVDVDIVVSSTAAPEPVIDRELAARVMRRRRSRPLFLIDIAVPRDIDPAVAEIANVYVYNIDDLQALVRENLSSRQGAVAEANSLIDRKLDDMLASGQEQVGPLIVSLQDRVAGIKDRELRRLFARQEEFSAEDQEHIRRCVDRIANKILHDPIISLRRELRNEREGTGIVRVFKEFFNL
jgi:glutamyl-tRNA reductase